jgi:hypothetical protein
VTGYLFKLLAAGHLFDPVLFIGAVFWVPGPTLNKAAISGISRISTSRIRFTSTYWAGARAGGLPLTRPRFRVASMPSFVRSTIPYRSKWAINLKK